MESKEEPKVYREKDRAEIKVHGVENSQTFEHPASFAATNI